MIKPRPATEAPPSSSESMASIKTAIGNIRWELRSRPALDTSELEDALHFADQFLWDVVDVLRENAKANH